MSITAVESLWTIKVWDGYSSRSFTRRGTYGAPAMAYIYCAPPGHIVSIS